MRLRFWCALDSVLMALPFWLVARSPRLRRAQRWVLLRLVLAQADAMRQWAKGDV